MCTHPKTHSLLKHLLIWWHHTVFSSVLSAWLNFFMNYFSMLSYKISPDQTARMFPVHRSLWVTPQIPGWIEGWAPEKPVGNADRSAKPLLWCAGCTRWVAVWLEHETPSRLLQTNRRFKYFALKSTGIRGYSWFPAAWRKQECCHHLASPGLWCSSGFTLHRKVNPDNELRHHLELVSLDYNPIGREIVVTYKE